MNIELYEVGGCVRDDILGVPTKDVDFTVVAPSWDAMVEWLETEGFKIFVTTPEFLTARAHFPSGWSFNGRDCSKMTADFVLARKDGTYYDGRRPETVTPGTLYDDLARRDFTVNAMARDKDGNLIDPFNGREALMSKKLHAVGGVYRSFNDDALRAMRALRFVVTKGFTVDTEIYGALISPWLPPLLAKVVTERRVDELTKMFKHDTMKTLYLLNNLTNELRAAIFAGNVKLMPTMKTRKFPNGVK